MYYLTLKSNTAQFLQIKGPTDGLNPSATFFFPFFLGIFVLYFFKKIFLFYIKTAFFLKKIEIESQNIFEMCYFQEISIWVCKFVSK